MKKKLLMIVTAMILSIMTFSVSAFAAELGWNEDGTKYCIESTEDGDTYATGIYYVESEEAYYIFDEDGILLTDESFDTIKEVLYQFKEGKGAIFTGEKDGLYYVDGKKFEGTKDGCCYKDGKKFTGTKDGYYYEAGKKYTGTHNGYYYSKGKKYTGIHNGLYYKNGKKFSGIRNHKYYSSGKNVTAANGKDRISKMPNGKYYYVTSEGKLYDASKTGVKKMANGKWYYFYKDSDKICHVTSAGKKEISGKTYYFNSNSSILTSGKSCFKTVGESTYRVAADGHLVSGWVTVGEKKYYMSKKTFKRYEGKVATIGKYSYWFSKKGVMQAGKWKKKDGKKTYYFNKKGHMLKSTSSYIGKYKYFFNKKGVLQRDLVKYKGFEWVASHRIIIKVNRTNNVVTLYAADGNKGYTIPVKALLCTVGSWDRPTDKGTYTTGAIYRWKELGGKTETEDNGELCYGQYVTHFHGNMYFHSIVCSENGNNHTLYTGAYNWLGNAGSHGCVRLQTGNAYLVYRLAARQRMTVVVYDGKSPGPFGKPKLKKISTCYDPTDPNV